MDHILTLRADIIVLFPFHLQIPFPRAWREWISAALRKARILDPKEDAIDDEERKPLRLPGLGWDIVLLQMPLNFVTVRPPREISREQELKIYRRH